jgi:uncharacterized repeat protein (TIGR03803 family)
MSPYEGDFNCGYRNSSCGLLYRLTQKGKNRVLHVFEGSDGIRPEGGLVVSANGDLYGTALLGGNLKCESGAGTYHVPQGCGTVYRLDKKGNFTVLHTFTGGRDGSAPLGLTQDADGNLYGIASNGGNVGSLCPFWQWGCGTIFKIDMAGNFSVIYRFTAAITEPNFDSHLVLDSAGNLYGANGIGGANNTGFIFKVSPAGDFSAIVDFPSDIDTSYGIFPQGIVRDSAGNFYGTMLADGVSQAGTLFKVTF